jgi:N-acetylneuraminic acid mutarotase
MYVLGGIVGKEVIVASVLKFDSTQDTWSAWSRVEPMPEPRKLHAACAIGSDIYAFGGVLGLERQRSVFRFDTETNTWSTLEPMPRPCYTYSVSIIGGYQVYIVGAGDDGKGVLRFDTSSGVWSMLRDTSNNKHGSAFFVVGGCLYVAGGESDSSSVKPYEVATDT